MHCSCFWIGDLDIRRSEDSRWRRRDAINRITQVEELQTVPCNPSSSCNLPTHQSSPTSSSITHFRLTKTLLATLPCLPPAPPPAAAIPPSKSEKQGLTLLRISKLLFLPPCPGGGEYPPIPKLLTHLPSAVAWPAVCVPGGTCVRC